MDESKGERLPRYPKVEDVLRVQAGYRAKRKDASELQAARERKVKGERESAQELELARELEAEKRRQRLHELSAKRPEIERKIESFPLSGFFDKVRLEEIQVGRHLIFRVPSTADMEKLYRFVRHSDAKTLVQSDQKFVTDRTAILKRVSYWVGRGQERLRQADHALAMGWKYDFQARLDDARHSLLMAQKTSEAFGQRYFPEASPDKAPDSAMPKIGPENIEWSAHAPRENEVEAFFPSSSRYELDGLKEVARQVQIRCRTVYTGLPAFDRGLETKQVRVTFEIRERNSTREFKTTGTLTPNPDDSSLYRATPTLDSLPWEDTDWRSSLKNKLAVVAFQQAIRPSIE